MTAIDHFMYAVPDLDAGVRWAAERFDAAPVHGGAHVGLGTRNALLSLGETYLEIIAPDPAQDIAPGSMGARFADLAEGGLVTWAASAELGAVAGQLAAQGIASAGPTRTERRTAEGELLVWELLFPRRHGFGGCLPFFIDWMACAHPSATTPVGGRLLELAITHPEAAALRGLFAELGLRVPVTPGAPAMVVRVECAGGVVELATTAATANLSWGS